jgi:hypothetical protein
VGGPSGTVERVLLACKRKILKHLKWEKNSLVGGRRRLAPSWRPCGQAEPRWQTDLLDNRFVLLYDATGYRYVCISNTSQLDEKGHAFRPRCMIRWWHKQIGSATMDRLPQGALVLGCEPVAAARVLGKRGPIRFLDRADGIMYLRYDRGQASRCRSA